MSLSLPSDGNGGINVGHEERDESSRIVDSNDEKGHGWRCWTAAAADDSTVGTTQSSSLTTEPGAEGTGTAAEDVEDGPAVVVVVVVVDDDEACGEEDEDEWCKAWSSDSSEDGEGARDEPPSADEDADDEAEAGPDEARLPTVLLLVLPPLPTFEGVTRGGGGGGWNCLIDEASREAEIGEQN